MSLGLLICTRLNVSCSVQLLNVKKGLVPEQHRAHLRTIIDNQVNVYTVSDSERCWLEVYTHPGRSNLLVCWKVPDKLSEVKVIHTASLIAQWQSAGFECGRSRVQSPVKDRLLDSQVVECWLRVQEVPGSIPSQEPRHTKGVIKWYQQFPCSALNIKKGNTGSF